MEKLLNNGEFAGAQQTILPARDCRHFNGYKPCRPGIDCTDECKEPAPFGTRILIVNLDALGDVIMTTAQLRAIKQQYPQSTIFWLTHRSALPLLQENPFIFKAYGWTDEERMILQRQSFDLVLNADKSTYACAFVETLSAKEVRGFRLNAFGQIVPANTEAMYNFQLGLDDHLKFRVNQRTGQDILAESWQLPYGRDPYVLNLTTTENALCRDLRHRYGFDGKIVVGFNTGCSILFPNKKMTIEQHVALIERLSSDRRLRFVLLGGREDTERNAEIEQRLIERAIPVTNTPTTEGLRRGLCYLNIADVVVTGDSFGMHAAIGLGKFVCVWFGLSCWTEIDLYDRGKKFFHPDLACSPCWKRECPEQLECIARIPLDEITHSIVSFADSFEKRTP